MEEPKKTLLKQEKNKTVISIGKAAGGVGGGGGGGIGVGIIILGGAVVSATAAFLIRRRLGKSSNGENCKHDDQSTASTEVQCKIIEDKNVNQVKDLHVVVSDSSPDIDSDLNSSNGIAKTGVHENNKIKISDQSFLFLDENYKLEADDRKGNPVSDYEGIILSDSPRQSENPVQLDTSAIEKEEPPLLIVQNQTFLHPTNADDNLSTEKIEFIKEDGANETALADQGKEEERQHMPLNNEGEDMKINSRRNEDTREFNCQECPIHSDQAIGSTGGSLPKTAALVGQGSFLPVPVNSSFRKDEKLDSEEGSLAFETVEIKEKDHSLMRQEEDSIDDEAEAAKMAEKVEESSEETGDSSAASNAAEAIWPAESCQELIMEQKELKLNGEKEKQQMEEDETVKTQVDMHLKNIDDDGINEKENSLQKGNLKMTVLERYMRKQFDQPTNSKNRRILMLTMLVLSGCLCFWHFGRPFLKICLMVILILIVVLSKIHRS